MNNQLITNRPLVEVKPGDWRAIDAGSAAQWQNVITSHRELTDAIRDALRTIQLATHKPPYATFALSQSRQGDDK